LIGTRPGWIKAGIFGDYWFPLALSFLPERREDGKLKIFSAFSGIP